ncbi:hypothetical protein C2W62_38885 [Candidatus Entotheonella serta]|nr:hypothetical protein C2W62_38885 [Candidatus Entotheonella serta]
MFAKMIKMITRARPERGAAIIPAHHLASKNPFENTISIIVELYGMKNRTLIMDDPQRGKLFDDYICKVDMLPYSEELSIESLISQPGDFALKNIVWFFERFNWHNISKNSIKNIQSTLLHRHA